MFGIGFGELVLILVIAFVFVGPKDLPKVARAIARFYKKIRLLWNEVLAAINLEEEVDEIKQTKEEVENALNESNPIKIIKKEIDNVTKTVQVSVKETEKKFRD